MTHGSESIVAMQRDVGEWHSRVLSHQLLEQMALKLCEEAGEVGKCISYRGLGISPHKDWDAELRKECADVQITLLALCEREGFSLAATFNERWPVVKQRDPATGWKGTMDVVLYTRRQDGKYKWTRFTPEGEGIANDRDQGYNNFADCEEMAHRVNGEDVEYRKEWEQ